MNADPATAPSTAPATSATTATRVLVVVAAPAEAAAASRALGVEAPCSEWSIARAGPRFDPGFDLVRTGVGKANAAAGVARVLDLSTHRAVLNIGIAGALPGSELALGTSIAASASANADEGVRTPEGFLTCSDIGFPLAPAPFGTWGVPADPALLHWMRGEAQTVGVVATVSTCSGTDQAAREVAARTGAIAEAMEGAAIGQVCARLGVPFGELRLISNTTGDRAAQRWDVRAALARLADVLGRLRRTMP